jgi:outer membrane protein OmpA-like peptidoglycan-associated protein
MKTLLAVSFVLVATLTTGCATKKYVREQTTPIQAKVDQVGEQTTRQGQAIEETRGEVKQVDERAQTGISAAQERAAAADSRAQGAEKQAQEAMGRANEVGQTAQRNTQEIAGLRQVVSNLEDYKLAGEAAVGFRFDSATLTDEAKQQLDQLVSEKGQMKRFFIAVQGYTDTTGSAEYNAALSRRRADAVVQYMVTNHNIPIYRIHMIGLGEQQPAEEGRTRAARAKNRRVEVRFFSADDAVQALSSGQTTANQAGGEASRTQR